MKKEKFVVCMSVDGYVEVEVEATSPKEASELACEKVSEYDFGALRGVEWNTLHVENENGAVTQAEDL